MSRLEELKDEVAKKIGFRDWDDARHDLDESFIFEFAKIYAKECVEASLERASIKAKIFKDSNSGSYLDAYIKKESITNKENIILL